LNEEDPDQHRWKLALVLIDSFLSAFSFDLSQRKELLKTTAESYKKEFGFTHHHVKKQLDGKHRSFRKEIDNIMLWENEVSETIDIIKARKQAYGSDSGKIYRNGKIRRTSGVVKCVTDKYYPHDHEPVVSGEKPTTRTGHLRFYVEILYI
jgi:hypothetical protein